LDIKQNEEGKMLLEDFFLSIFGPGTYGTNWAAAKKLKKQLTIKKERGI